MDNTLFLFRFRTLPWMYGKAVAHQKCALKKKKEIKKKKYNANHKGGFNTESSHIKKRKKKQVK